MAVVKLRLGDLFDGPADLIVLPCSTVGTVTGFVGRALAHHSIPVPPDRMQLGEVETAPFEGGEHIAQYVAFAASVDGFASSTGAIDRISASLGAFTREHPSVRSVSAPLLGAGAGGLASEDVVLSLREGFLRTAHPDARLVIHVLHRDLFERLRAGRRPDGEQARERVRVFISHTSGSGDAVRWVEQLARFLMDSGVQARLDRFHLRRGMDLPQWMCNELALADKVIIVCDEMYRQKADGRLGGVGWETMIIQGDLVNLPPDSTKYQVLVREEELRRGLPMYLRTRYAFHAPPSDSSQSYRAELLRAILDQPVAERAGIEEIAI